MTLTPERIAELRKRCSLETSELLDALAKAEAEADRLDQACERLRELNDHGTLDLENDIEQRDVEVDRLRELAERMHWDVGWCYLNLEALQLPPGTRNEYFTERMTRAATLLDLFVFDEKKKTCKLKEDWRLE